MKPIELMHLGQQIGKVYEQFEEPVCKKYGLNHTALDILLFLASNPEYKTAKDICKIRGIKPALVSVGIDYLVTNRLLTRQNDTKDRRKQLLFVTEKAVPIIHDGKDMQRQFVKVLANGITKEENEAAQKSLQKMYLNLQQFQQHK